MKRIETSAVHNLVRPAWTVDTAVLPKTLIHRMYSSPRKAFTLLTGAVVLSVGPSQLFAVTFTPTYTGTGTAEQKNATTAALNSLASYFTDAINLPATINIVDSGGGGTLGSSSVSTWTAYTGGLFYPSPLYNVLTSTAAPAITMDMNINPSTVWEYGAVTPTGGSFSWQSVVMHEIIHSMGFYDGIANNTGALAQAGYTVFDSFTTLGQNGILFTSLADDAARLGAIQSNNLFWNGANGKAANGGNPVKLYAPGTFESGSTYSHIDPSETGKAGLLFPALPANTYYPGPTAVELGIMKDIGWSVAAVPEPSSYAWAFGVLAMTFGVWRRRQGTAAVPQV